MHGGDGGGKQYFLLLKLIKRKKAQFWATCLNSFCRRLWDVHANSGFSSFSSHRPFVDFTSNRMNLQIFSIKAEIWLQKPTLPATQAQLLSKTSPLTIHKASFNQCGGSFFLKLTAFSFELKNAGHWLPLFREGTRPQEMFSPSAVKWEQNDGLYSLCACQIL